jgi:hypothetical protein
MNKDWREKETVDEDEGTSAMGEESRAGRSAGAVVK